MKKSFQGCEGKESEQSVHLKDSISFADIGEPGPLITDVFSRLRDIPGWFTVDDCGHFFLILSYQSAVGITGDMLEIGSYFGRSTALMATCLKQGENIVVCDAFGLDTNDSYGKKPTPEELIANIECVNQGINRDRIVIHECMSNDLQLDTEERFRFIHIDGGHSAEQVYSDLNLCSKHLLAGGIMVVDDYHNDYWPDVTPGTDRFLDERNTFRVLADLNRHGSRGRKLYLIKQ